MIDSYAGEMGDVGLQRGPLESMQRSTQEMGEVGIDPGPRGPLLPFSIEDMQRSAQAALRKGIEAANGGPSLNNVVPFPKYRLPKSRR